MRYMRLTLLMILASLGSQAVSANDIDIVKELKDTPVSQYQFGLSKLYDAANAWAKDYRDGTRVLVGAQDQRFRFIIMSTASFTGLESKKEKSDMCERIFSSFANEVLANSGDPSAKNINGANMYLDKWGGYFSAPYTDSVERERIGRGVSVNSEVLVLVKNDKPCSFMSDDSY